MLLATKLSPALVKTAHDKEKDVGDIFTQPHGQAEFIDLHKLARRV